MKKIITAFLGITLALPALASASSVSDLISLYASKYEVSEAVMTAVVRCESYFDPAAVGDSGQSFGLSQIYLPAHPDITKEQALDPDFALNFLAYHLSKEQGYLWTCYRQMIK